MSNKSQSVGLLCALLIVPVLLYSQTLTFDFAFDDVLQITKNDVVTSNQTASGLLTPFFSPTPPGNLFRPLAVASYKLNYMLSGENAGMYHLTNVLLYAMLLALLFKFLEHLLADKKAAFIASLIFAVHPVNVEVVANIIGRAELLSAIFGLSACLLLRSRHLVAILAAGIALFLATMAKESAYAFFFLAPLYAALNSAPNARTARWRHVSAAVLLTLALLASFAVRYFAMGVNFIIHPDQKIWIENPMFHLSFVERLIPALKLLGDYILLWLAPYQLSADYSQTPVQLMAATFSARGALSILAVIILAAGTVLARRHKIAFGGLWFFAAFALTSNILTPIGTSFGERLLFVPSIGLLVLVFGMLSSYLRQESQRTLVWTLLYSLLLAVFAYKSAERIPVWRNNEVLFTQTVQDAPSSAKAKYLLAVELYLNKRDYQNAESLLRESLSIYPDYLLAMRLLADTLLAEHSFGQVEYWYHRILQLDPSQHDVRDNLNRLVAARARADTLKQ